MAGKERKQAGGGIAILAIAALALWGVTKAKTAPTPRTVLEIFPADVGFVKIIPPAKVNSQSELDMYKAIDAAVAKGEGYANIVRAEVGPAWDWGSDTPGRTEAMADYWIAIHPGEALPEALTPGYIGVSDLSVISSALGLGSLGEAERLIEARDPKALALLGVKERDKLLGITTNEQVGELVGKIDVSTSVHITADEEAILDEAIVKAEATGGTVGITHNGDVMVYPPGTPYDDWAETAPPPYSDWAESAWENAPWDNSGPWEDSAAGYW